MVDEGNRGAHRKTIAAGGGVLLVVGLCVAAALFFDGFYLPGKPCRPVQHPDGQRTARPFQSVAEAGLADVLAFYDDALPVCSRPGDTRLLTRQELAQGEFLYICYGADINRLSTEMGCIYVRQRTQETVSIEGMLFRSEGSNVQCPIE